MNRPAEATPAEVVTEPTQAGETIYQRWYWVEPSVWTERMLRTLEKGVKGGKWFSLIDKVYSKANLQSGFAAVWRNSGGAGVDGQSVAGFEAHLEKELSKLSEEVRTGRYRALPVRRVYIPKLGSHEKRPLGIPAVRDRVVQSALRHVMEPIFERQFAEHSYGFRPGRGCKDALRRVEELLQSGYHWVVDADLKSYFDTIPHEGLLRRVQEHISDGRVLKLIAAYLKAGVLEELRGWEPTECGTPQGAVISPLLANLYLNPLDQMMAAAGFELVRYADDFVILTQSQEQAQQALELVAAWVTEAGLQLHPQKTRIVDVQVPGGFDFLGYHFERGMKWPRRKSMHKLKDKLRPLTKRNSGICLQATITKLNPILRGWFNYFCHSKANTFTAVDGWVRGRLRSILRKRRKRRGRARGRDHQLWPNAYFAAAGLFSLKEAWEQLRQSHV
jgi:RNA-directed DNA polymerase